MPGRRNRVALNPLLRKGGAHQRSRSAHRSEQQEDLRKQLEDWLTDDKIEDEEIDTHQQPGNLTEA